MINIVSGGCGYIGSGLVRNLLDKGESVIVIDNISSGFKDAVPNVLLVERDISDNLDDIFETYEIKNVYHLAEKSSVSESVQFPERYLSGNVDKTKALISSCLKHKVKNFVYSSSAAVYGNSQLPLTEDLEPRPINPYGEAKHTIEKYLKEVSEDFAMNYYCMRYFNASGGDFQNRYGERHDPETHLIPNVIKAIMNGEKPKIFGDDYLTKDGTAVRDYVHIDDINRAHMEIINHTSGCYNLGSNKGYSVLEIVNLIYKKLNKEPNIDWHGRRNGDPDKLIANTAKIYSEIGWEPNYDMSNIIDTAYNFLIK